MALNMNFNPEIIQKMNAVIEVGEEGVFTKIREAIEEAKDATGVTNATKLINSANSIADTTENLIQTTTSLFEVLRAYTEDARKYQEAMGIVE